MEVSETVNGSTIGENIMKDPSAVQKDNFNLNGYTDDKNAEKVNGNSDLHNKNTSNDIDSMETSENETNENDHGDENLNKETLDTQQNELKVEDSKLKPEEELDNSTATSNISDISPYEDSEQSMDVETKEENENKVECDHVDEIQEKDDMPACSGKDVESKKDEFESRSENANLDENESKDTEAENINEDQTKLQDSKIHVSSSDEKMKDMKEDHKDCEKVDTEQESTTLDKDSSENGVLDEDANNSANDIHKRKTENLSDGLKINGGEKSSKEDKCQSKSIDKVTDIDGSEILITINEENEDSEGENEISSNGCKSKEENNDEGEKEETKKLKGDSNKDKKASNEIVVVNESPDKNEKMVAKVSKPVVMPHQATIFNSKQVLQPPIAPGPSQVRFPVIPGSSIQYFVPSSIQSMPNSQQKYINVGGQQILITIPTSSMGTVLNTSIIGTAGSSVLGMQSKPSGGMAMGFPLPNYNKNPLDKTLDLDIPQASWEQLELIKYEVLSRKPDNAFWGGLANVSKKADLSSASKLLFDLGSDLVKELAYEQIVQVQRKKDEADLLNASEKESLQRMKKVVEELKNKLEYLHDIPTLKCKCGFTTESRNVMFLHKQYPHVSYNTSDKSALLSCPHCNQSFQGKIAEDMFKAHIEKEHNIVARSNHKSNLWPCNLCTFEGANKNTIMKHKLKCEKNFKEHINQAPHHVDINLSLKNIFYKFQVHNKKLQLQQQAQQARKIAQIDRPDTRGNIPIVKHKPAIIQPKLNQAQAKPPPVVNPNRPIIPSHFKGPTPASTAYALQSDFSGTRFVSAPVQKQPQPLKPASVNKPTVNQLLRTQQNVNVNTRPGFEVCEICGGYVKDRMSLRIHFFYAHKIEMPAHVFSKPLAPLFCNICNERFWTSQGFTKHKNSAKHLNTVKQNASATNQCWICHQKPENLYSHLHKFHRLTTGECMALKRCMFCGTLSQSRKELELHMAATHGVLIKGEKNIIASDPVSSVIKPQPQSNAATKNLSTVVTGGSSGMVRNNFCVFCSSQFPDNTKLTLHCLSVHATCKKCGMVVNKSADLARHVCKMASKTCSICGLKNLKPAGLIKHLESHTKPCSVALKRLSPSQINIATGGKFMRLDPRLRTRNARSTANIIEGEIKTEQTKGLTVAMNFDKPRKGKVIIDLSGKTDSKKEQVVIESDNDSDVIIEEEERTEIVLDSDDDAKSENDKTESKSKKNDSETKDESGEERNIKIECETTKDKNHTSDRENDKTEIEGKSLKENEENDKGIPNVKEENEKDKPNVKEENDKDTAIVKEENDQDTANVKEENDNGKHNEFDVKRPNVKEENNEDKLNETEDNSNEKDENDEKCENMEENEKDMTTDSKIVDDSVEKNKGQLTENEEHRKISIEDTNSSKNALENEECDSVQSENSTGEDKNLSGNSTCSRKRSRSECEDSEDPEEDTKKRKTDEDSDNS